MPKRKRSSVLINGTGAPSLAIIPINATAVASEMVPPVPLRRASTRKAAHLPPAAVNPNPDTNAGVEDGPEAIRASPDGADAQVIKLATKRGKGVPASAMKPLKKAESVDTADPEADGEEDADPEELREALSRPPPVNSSYLPLPWKGRIGYACLNTYLRYATPPIFCSRTCRIASILEHRHPLRHPSQPEHPTKNRPDKGQPPDVARGQAWVEALGLANARDIPKMLRWNHRYGIKFLRLSSEMFPFASHQVYGYKLAPFASEVLAEAGSVAAEIGHRLTTHPGQFTQLGSPRKEVITASIRDLEFHCELLDLLKLPPQQDRDAVMILHMGGIFGDKAATLERFKGNYQKLSPGIKRRLVLENDDVCYSVHDLLPICEEMNIPLVLDYHHHNIVFNADKVREGTLDIMNLYERIKATWTRKGIAQKMHYSEPTSAAITARQRRKHSPRVMTLPPCPPDMDLMIEAKDKEQAVFELMRTFKLPGFDTFNDILPHARKDENKPWKAPKKKKTPKKRKGEDPVEDDEPEHQPPPIIPEEEVSMGGPEGRVYWPPGMEEWLRPKKREVKPRDALKAKSTAEKAAEKRVQKAAWQAAREASAEQDASALASASELAKGETLKVDAEKATSVYDEAKASKGKPVRSLEVAKKAKSAKSVSTPRTSDHEEDDEARPDMPDLTDAEAVPSVVAKMSKERPPATQAASSRRTKRKAVNYVEGDADD